MESNLSTEGAEAPGAAGDAAGSPLRATRRRHILASARQTFLRDGYRQATMERVAGDAGVSKQTLYNYFADKEELFAALLELCLREELVSDIATALGGITDREPEAALRATAETLFRYASTPEIAALHRIMIEAFTEAPELIHRFKRQFFLHNVEIVRGALEWGAAAGTLRAVDAEAVAYFLFGIAASYGLFRPTADDELARSLSPERMARALADLISHGLIAANSAESKGDSEA